MLVQCQEQSVSAICEMLNCRFRGLFWKAARIGSSLELQIWQRAALSSNIRLSPCMRAAGERLSPWVAVACIVMGVTVLLF